MRRLNPVFKANFAEKGSFGKKKIHYQAPGSDRIEPEMIRFPDWFENEHETDLVLKAAIAHLWFLTIHPFDDGNGRIARAITDMTLARSDKSVMRFYSMSAQIRVERKQYYEKLEKTQKGNSDITEWILWSLQCLLNPQIKLYRKYFVKQNSGNFIPLQFSMSGNKIL